MQMSLTDFLAYAEKFEGRRYYSLEVVERDIEKVKALMTRFGFEYYKSFSHYCGDYSGKEPDTTIFYRVQAGESEYGYIEIQLGYLIKGKYKNNFEGVFRVSQNLKPDLNPKTNAPWQIGDIKHVNPYYSLTLTRNGWWSGD
jgi:hypothetical protein